MAQIGTIKLQTEKGTVQVPVYNEGDSGSNIYEFLKVQTEKGTGFIPLTEPSDAEYNYIKVQTEKNGVVAVHTETALGLTEIQNYIEDDWNDNKLTNRDNTQDGLYPYPQSFDSSDDSSDEYDQGKVAGDVLIGRYRPEWETDGSVSVGHEELTCNAANDRTSIYTASGLETGTWKIEAKNGANVDGSSGYGNPEYLVLEDLDSSGYYRITYATLNTSYRLQNDNTTVVSSSANMGTSFNSHKVTRTSYGDWELIFNGSSKGSSTSTHLPKFERIRHTNITDNGNGGSDVTYDNLVVQ